MRLEELAEIEDHARGSLSSWKATMLDVAAALRAAWAEVGSLHLELRSELELRQKTAQGWADEVALARQARDRADTEVERLRTVLASIADGGCEACLVDYAYEPGTCPACRAKLALDGRP